MLMSGKTIAILVAFGAVLCLALPTNSRAADNPALNADILKIALDWEHIKFQETDKDLQEKEMAALADRAAALVQQYQTRPEAMIWHGIIISEQASMASENGSPFKALGFAKRARAILAPLATTNPAILDAGAPATLGG